MQVARATAPSRLVVAMVWSLAVLAVLFLVWPVWRAFLPLEIWGNEGWNAYHTDSAMRGSGLYPPADGLVASNYPPLSYFLIGWLSRLVGGDPLYVGRAVSIVSTLGIGVNAALIVRQLGGSRAAQMIAGLWFVATMARFFDFYVGMNEPQIFGLWVMSGALVWFLKLHSEGRAAEPAILAMVLAGFIKHNFITIPLVALLWLTLDNWRLGLRAAIVGGIAAAFGLALCAWLFAPNFISDMLMPRSYDWQRGFSTMGRTQFVLPALLLWAAWAWRARASAPARFTGWMVGIALPLYLIQKTGAGVDENAQFELVFATALGIGLAFDGLRRDPWRNWTPNAVGALVLGVLILRLLLSTRLEFAYVMFSPQYRALAAEHAAVARAEAARVAAMPGNVACRNLVVCRMAGKPFVYDLFWVTQIVETGKMSWHGIEALARSQGIVKDDTDQRANVTSLWRRMRSD